MQHQKESFLPSSENESRVPGEIVVCQNFNRKTPNAAAAAVKEGILNPQT